MDGMSGIIVVCIWVLVYIEVEMIKKEYYLKVVLKKVFLKKYKLVF